MDLFPTRPHVFIISISTVGGFKFRMSHDLIYCPYSSSFKSKSPYLQPITSVYGIVSIPPYSTLNSIHTPCSKNLIDSPIQPIDRSTNQPLNHSTNQHRTKTIHRHDCVARNTFFYCPFLSTPYITDPHQPFISPII